VVEDGQHGFEAFFQRQFAPLVGVLWAYCGERVVAEGCAAEALTRAARDWERVSAMAAPSGWLHRVAFNVANSHFRRRRAERRAIVRHGRGSDVDDAAVEVVQAVAVCRAMSSLSRRQRQAVALYYLAELSVAEIADVM
jgi:RNA polymerase sigma factor (sigma-70 family)